MKDKRFIRCGSHFPVKNIRATIEYYRDTLGFHDEWIWKDKDGGIRRDDMRLLFSEDPDYVNNINTGKNRFVLIWFVDNIDAIFKEFQAKNIPIESPLQLHPYDMWEFAFVDINGYYIRVSEAAENK